MASRRMDPRHGLLLLLVAAVRWLAVVLVVGQLVPRIGVISAEVLVPVHIELGVVLGQGGLQLVALNDNIKAESIQHGPGLAADEEVHPQDTPPAKHDDAADFLDVDVHHVHSRGQRPPPQLNGEAQRHRGPYRVEQKRLVAEQRWSPRRVRSLRRILVTTRSRPIITGRARTIVVAVHIAAIIVIARVEAISTAVFTVVTVLVVDDTIGVTAVHAGCCGKRQRTG